MQPARIYPVLAEKLEVPQLGTQDNLLHNGPSGHPVEQKERLGDVLCGHHPALRNPTALPGRRNGRPRVDAAHAHTLVPELSPHGLREAGHAELRGRVGSGARAGPVMPAIDPMLKMSPRPRRTMAGANARLTRKRLRRFAESIRSKSATDVSRNGAPTYLPALLMSTSTAPNRRLTPAAIPATSDSSDTSHGNTATSERRRPQERATTERLARLRATRARRTPGIPAAKALEIAAPIPCEAPVTTTTGGFVREAIGRVGT